MPRVELKGSTIAKLKANPPATRVDGQGRTQKSEVLYFDTHKHAPAGFGLRVTSSGAASFFLDYRFRGRQRRFTIGAYPELTVTAARGIAEDRRADIRAGKDPLEERRKSRAVATVAELGEHYLREVARPKGKRTVEDDERMLRVFVNPALGRRRVDNVTRADVRRLHREVAEPHGRFRGKDGRPVRGGRYRANRVLSLLSALWNLAVDEGWASENVARAGRKGLDRFHEEPRERFLSREEIARLLQALEARPKRDRSSVNAVKLMLLTGCRRGEALKATWSDFDLDRGVWTKPSHHTKTKTTEKVRLSGAAVRFLSELRKSSEGEVLFLGPSGRPLSDVKHFWQSVRRQAGLDGVRLHDLRHSFASHLVSSGLSLHVVGKLLGHTQASTTQRYAHVFSEAQREAAEVMGRVFEDARAAAIGERPPDNLELLKRKATRV